MPEPAGCGFLCLFYFLAPKAQGFGIQSVTASYAPNCSINVTTAFATSSAATFYYSIAFSDNTSFSGGNVTWVPGNSCTLIGFQIPGSDSANQTITNNVSFPSGWPLIPTRLCSQVMIRSWPLCVRTDNKSASVESNALSASCNTATNTPLPTNTHTATPTSTPTPTKTSTPTNTPVQSTATETYNAQQTATATAAAYQQTLTATAVIATVVWQETNTAVATATQAAQETATLGFQETATQNAVNSYTHTATPSWTPSPTWTPSFTWTPSNTRTPSFTPTYSWTPTYTNTFTWTNTFTITDTPTIIPCASNNIWLDGDLGGSTLAGTTSGNLNPTASSPLTITGGGAGIGGTADQFHYHWTNLSGPGTIMADMVTVSGTDRFRGKRNHDPRRGKRILGLRLHGHAVQWERDTPVANQ